MLDEISDLKVGQSNINRHIGRLKEKVDNIEETDQIIQELLSKN